MITFMLLESCCVCVCLCMCFVRAVLAVPALCACAVPDGGGVSIVRGLCMVVGGGDVV